VARRNYLYPGQFCNMSSYPGTHPDQAARSVHVLPVFWDRRESIDEIEWGCPKYLGDGFGAGETLR
jgi:hypothetical protein